MAKLYAGFGENKTLKEWSKDIRCPCGFNTLKSRIYYGYSMEEAFSLGKNKSKKFKYLGEEKTLREWSVDKRCQCDYKSLYNRIGKGWTFERAFTEKKYEFNRTSEVGEYVGKEFNNVRILSRKNRQKNARRVLVNCKCLLCGGEFVADFSHVKTGKTKSCSCVRKNKGRDSLAWSGHGGISKSYFSSIEYGAKERGLDFLITIEDIWAMFLKQGGKCALSGIELTFPKTRRDLEYNASLDRVDSSKGYSIDNIQWVDRKINFAKQQMSNDEFVELCNLVCIWKEKK